MVEFGQNSGKESEKDNILDVSHQMPKPILFLDCDGVINNRSTFENQKTLLSMQKDGYIFLLEQQLVDRFKALCQETGAVVVVSSSWRNFHEREEFIKLVGDWLEDHVPKTAAWRTNTIPNSFRGLEINDWFLANETFKDCPYVIFDDGNDFFPEQHHVLCSFDEGLTESNIDNAKQLLENQGFLFGR